MVQILNAEVSILGIIVAVVLNMVIGMLWFGAIFGKQWLVVMGKKKEELVAKNSDYAKALVSGFVTAFFLSLLVSYAYVNSNLLFGGLFGTSNLTEDFLLSGAWSDWLTGLLVGLFVWIAAALPVELNRLTWEGANKKLVMINSLHMLVTLVTMSITVALFMDLN